MDIWFTSDTHFGHKRILDFCSESRPFASPEIMNEALISSWNQQVKPNDSVYHLGDFSFMNKTRTLEILEQLNGQIYLIYGNHDHVMREAPIRRKLTWAGEYKERTIENRKVCMFHYPIHEWNKAHHGSYHLYGHVHGNHVGRGRSMDVGMDTHQCKLYHWDEINTFLKDCPIITHHGKSKEH